MNSITSTGLRNNISLLLLILFTIFATANSQFSQNSDVYQLQATLTSGLPANSGDNFGVSVAVDGDTAIVGTENQKIGSNETQGAAYIYVRSGSMWSLQQMLTSSDGRARDKFGAEVAIQGDTAFVTRYNSTTAGFGDGKIYVFKRTGTTWTQTQTIVSNDIASGDAFGSAMAVDGGTLVAGAPGKGFLGAAYIFTADGGGTWTQRSKLTQPDAVLFDNFGYSVDISGDSLIIGNIGASGLGAEQGRGFAYIYTGSGSSWTLQQRIQASDRAAGDAFGFDVAISEDTAAIGALNDDDFRGGVYVFTRSGSAWTQQTKIVHPNTSTLNRFGTSVALEGQTLAISAPRFDAQPNPIRGTVVYTRNGAAWNQIDFLESSGSLCVDIDNNTVITGQASSGSSSNGNVSIHASTAAPMPTATVGGRVFTPNGLPLRNAVVTITDSENVRRTATTSSFGVYSFDNVRTGETYTLSVASKRYRFAPKVESFSGNVSNADFVGLE